MTRKTAVRVQSEIYNQSPYMDGWNNSYPHMGLLFRCVRTETITYGRPTQGKSMCGKSASGKSRTVITKERSTERNKHPSILIDAVVGFTVDGKSDVGKTVNGIAVIGKANAKKY